VPSSSLTDSVASDMSSWWPKTTGSSKDDDKAAVVSIAAVSQGQSLSVVASGGSSQPGSAPPSLPQSPSARRGVNLLDEVVSRFAIAVTSVVHTVCTVKQPCGCNIRGGPKNVSTCYCQNFVKSPPNLLIFGTRTA